MTKYIAKIDGEEIVLKPALLEFGEHKPEPIPVYDLNGREIGTATIEEMVDKGSFYNECIMSIPKEEYEKLELTDDGKLPISIGYKCEGLEDARRHMRMQELEQCRDEVRAVLERHGAWFDVNCHSVELVLRCSKDASARVNYEEL